MNKKIFLAICSFTIATSFINAEPSKETPITISEITGKKITCSEMDMLNSQLTIFPMGIIRMRLASKKIRDVLKNVSDRKPSLAHNKALEKTFVSEQLGLIIKPVQEFFDVIQDPMVLNMVKPIIADALDNPKKSYILDFCNSKKNILTFCDETITDCATLEAMSKELLQFFGSITLSVSDKATAAAKKLEDQLKQAQADKKKADKK